MYKIIAVDFDGTLSLEAEWPTIGVPNTKLIQWLRRERTRGAKIILWTCREGATLQDALLWCADQGLVFDAVNDNIPEVVQTYSNNSRKVVATVYIDDKAQSLYGWEESLI